MMTWKGDFLADHLIRIILIAVACDLVFFPLLFMRLVHSRYFKLKSKQTDLDHYVRYADAIRDQKASSYFYFDNLNPETSKDWHIKNNAENLQVLVLIFTVRRHPEDFLYQTVSELDYQIKKLQGHSEKVGFVICNANLNPLDHKSATDLERFYDLIHIYKNERTHGCCSSFSCSHTTPAKELADYYECVARVRNQYSFDHLLVLEDDVVANQNTLFKVFQLIEQKLSKMDDWFMVKLFYTLRLQGFEMTLRSIVELLAFTLLVSWSFTYIHLKKFKWKSRFLKPRKAYILYFVICLGFILSFGRQNTVLLLQQYFTPLKIENAHSVGNLAVLYSRKSLEKLSEILTEYLGCYGPEIDLKIYHTALDLGLKSYWIPDNLFTHIGFQTSLLLKSDKTDTDYFVTQQRVFPDFTGWSFKNFLSYLLC